MRDFKAILPPRGYDGIIKTFGDITAYIIAMPDGTQVLGPDFAEVFIVRIVLPFPIGLAAFQNKSDGSAGKVNSIRCHKLLKGHFLSIFDTIARQGLADNILSFGGCFHFRSKISGHDLSTHSWGIAIDLNPETNRRGRPGDMHPAIVDIFKARGFIWGGDWKGPQCDPMHFQYCDGY
jgi:hypothetical protein